MSKKGKEKRQQKREERKDKRQDKKEQREKEGKKNIFQNAKDKINSFIKHPQNLVISAGLTPLKPYQPLMKNKLKKMGKPPGNNLAETTNNFVKYVMKKENYELWQFENFQNACFTPNVEDLEFDEEEHILIEAASLSLIGLIPEIIKTINDLFKKEPDLDDPKNPAPDLPDNDDDWGLDQTSYTLLLSYNDDMKQYLAKAGQTYTNNPIENAYKIYQITYPSKQTWENNFGQDIKAFWKNNKDEILATIGGLFVAVGTDPAPDPISQRIGKGVSSTQTAIEQEVKKQAKLKTYTPLLITAAVLAIILITKKK